MKTTPWNKIKAEYLQGVTPKELAEKYKIKAKTISDKAYEEDWRIEKQKISENIREMTEGQIQELTLLALARLGEILAGNSNRPDFVNAIGKALDISGLKNSKQVIEGIESGVNVIINRQAVQVESNN